MIILIYSDFVQINAFNTFGEKEENEEAFLNSFLEDLLNT